MERLRAGMAKRLFTLPWLTRPPIGFTELSKLVTGQHNAEADTVTTSVAVPSSAAPHV
jgi:hypothetical protein